MSLSSPPSELPGMRRQGSKVSYGSNDSNGSSNSASILKVRENNKFLFMPPTLKKLKRHIALGSSVRSKFKIWFEIS